MPQLEALTYFTQIFWFLLFFIWFYIIIANYIIPVIGTIFKVRRLLKNNSSILLLEENNNIKLEPILELLKVIETTNNNRFNTMKSLIISSLKEKEKFN